MLLNRKVLSRFVLVGILNTVLGLGVIFAAKLFVGDFLANFIGYLFVVPVSFLTHRDISFRDQGARISSFLRYIPTIGAGYAANLTTLHFLIGQTNGHVAQTAAISSHVAVTYLLSRLFVFTTPEVSSEH